MTTTLETAKPRLRVFRIVDEAKLSEAVIESITDHEGTLPYVDADRARDSEITEEIMEATTSAVLVDERGDQVAEFDGPDGWKQAEKARDSARITFSLDVSKPKAPRGAKTAAEKVEVTDEDVADDADPSFD